jgi:anaphase-promoting complex subunit 4
VTQDIEICLDLTGRAIFIASWLAAVTRRELARFKEFITWIRAGTPNTACSSSPVQTLFLAETTAANTPNDFQPQLRHDVLEVNNYFTSGLVVSSIDKWFMGPVPQFNPRELGIVDSNLTLRTTIEHARAAVDQTKWQVVCLPCASIPIFSH